MQPDRTEARGNAIRWAREMTQHAGTVYLDTETTGIGPGAEIVDFALINVNGQILYESLVKPDVPIPPEATAIHGITDAMVANAPSWPEIFPQVAPVLRQAHRVVIYNADFDRRVIDQVTQRNILCPLHFRPECAMRQYAEYAGIWHERHGNWRWHRLEQAASAFGAPTDGQHRALFDAQLCRAVVVGMAAQALPVLDRLIGPIHSAR